MRWVTDQMKTDWPSTVRRICNKFHLLQTNMCLNEPFYICLFCSKCWPLDGCFIMNNNFIFFTSIYLPSCLWCSAEERWVTVSCVLHDDNKDLNLVLWADVLIPAGLCSCAELCSVSSYKTEWILTRSDIWITRLNSQHKPREFTRHQKLVVVIKHFITK